MAGADVPCIRDQGPARSWSLADPVSTLTAAEKAAAGDLPSTIAQGVVAELRRDLRPREDEETGPVAWAPAFPAVVGLTAGYLLEEPVSWLG